MSQIPDDSYYNAEPESECSGDDWQRCFCEACQGRRDEYADMLYERQRNEELGL